MASASTPPLHVLRGILRIMKQSKPSLLPEPQPTTNAVQLTLRQHIISQYRQAQTIPHQKAGIQRKIAYDFFTLKSDLQERARLHELDQGADEKLSPRELSRRAAARAGLQLPELSSEEEARRREE